MSTRRATIGNGSNLWVLGCACLAPSFAFVVPPPGGSVGESTGDSGAASARDDKARVAQLVADGEPSAVLRFAIVDAKGGAALPGRLTFVGPRGPGAKLFTRTDAAPNELAVRYDVVYALHGAASITVPVGKHTVYASRGLEWGLAQREFTFEAGQTYEWKAELAHELDTTGWIGADFHLHTRTFSGHGDANLEERVISLAGEGVEFAVATDHDHNTDYRPTMEALGAKEAFTAITGDEVSTPLGHFNLFPLDPARTPIDSSLRDANALFRLARAETNAFGIVPVIQLNHPRVVGLDWFGGTGFDAVTGVSTSKAWSGDFDTLEVFNANNNSGYADSDLESTEPSSMGSVLRDWFHLLDRGERYGVVGNSDSHTVHFEFAGFPRNFVPSSTDDPAQIDPREVALALREKRTFCTSGPFIEVRAGAAGAHGVEARAGATGATGVAGRANEGGMGAQVSARDGAVELLVRVRAASWIDVDRAKVWVNGELAAELPVPAARTPLRLEQRLTLPLERDAWIVVCVEGDDALAPLLPNTQDLHLPRAVTNPIWVDADGDGVWTSPWALAQLAATSVETDSTALRLLQERAPSEAALFVIATSDLAKPPAHARALVAGALAHVAREVRLAGARAAEKLASPELCAPLERAFAAAKDDGFARLCFYRALRACKSDARVRLWSELLGALREDRREAYRGEIQREFPGRYVDRWDVRGPVKKKLSEAAGESLDFTAFGDAHTAELERDDKGFVDLRALAPEKKADEQLFVARALVRAPRAGAFEYALGSDDGCVLRVNGKLVLRDDETHGATLRHFGKLELREGDNEIVVAVFNKKGASGVRLGLLDPQLAWGAR